MFIRTTLAAAVAAMALLAILGCAVLRGQETVDTYVDDAGITASVSARLLNDQRVAGISVSVETLNGAVMLSGLAKNKLERDAAAKVARGVNGVKAIRKEIDVRS